MLRENGERVMRSKKKCHHIWAHCNAVPDTHCELCGVVRHHFYHKGQLCGVIADSFGKCIELANEYKTKDPEPRSE